jgi:RNA polymerase sigma-70 factor (ECF subfamily)
MAGDPNILISLGLGVRAAIESYAAPASQLAVNLLRFSASKSVWTESQALPKRQGNPIDAVIEKSAPEELSDEEIVAICQRGETKYFEILVRRYMEKAFHIALNFTRNSEEAKDLSQDAFLRAFTRINQFDGRSSFYTWFYRLVINICLDATRRKNRVGWESLEVTNESAPERPELTDNSSLPEDMTMAREAKRRADRTLEKMPNKQRTAFMLRNHQGLSIADIAKVMKTTEATVRVYLHRAVSALRQSLVEFV